MPDMATNGDEIDPTDDQREAEQEQVYVTSYDRKVYHKALRDWLQKAREETPGEKDAVVAWRPDHSNFWFHLTPVEVDTQHDFNILYGTEALVDVYDPIREYASLQEKDDPHEHRHNVQHTDWL